MRALRLSVLAIATLACAGGDRSHAAAANDTASTRPAAASVVHRDTGRGPRAESRSAAAVETAPAVVDTSAPPPRPARVRHLATPDPMRGLYVSRAVAQGPGVWRLVELARRTSVNALVFDVKDDQGVVLYPSTVGLAHLIGADAVHPMPVPRLHALMDSLRKYRIYAVARIVVARDPILASKRPQWGLVHRADDPERNAWVDPRRREIWAYAADLASEAAARGFSAVQFDDAQFPPSKGLGERLELRSLSGPTAGEVIRAQLGFLASRLDPVGVPMAIGVDAMSAVDSSDLGVGARWETFADQADLVFPREFPSAFPRGTLGVPDPGTDPYEAVSRALAAARRRNAGVRDAARVVPWYQDFSSGAATYGDAQVRAQIRAGEANGIRSWLLWNPDGTYTESALRPPVRADSAKAKRPTARAGGRSRR